MKKKFRKTWKHEVIIEAETEEEAEQIWESISHGKLDQEVADGEIHSHEFVEDVSLSAADIITAVRDNNWEIMLKLFPEGVEHKTYKYDSTGCFTDWDDYQDYVRYVEPAREMMKEKCLNKALEYLNTCS